MSNLTYEKNPSLLRVQGISIQFGEFLLPLCFILLQLILFFVLDDADTFG